MQHLFSDFKPATAAEWKSQLVKDLKGEAYENLTWKNENGFDIAPFYTSENLKQAYEPAFAHAGWDICVTGKSTDPKILNKQLLQNLASGATSVFIDCEGLDLDVALNGVQLHYIQSAFVIDEKSAHTLKTWIEKQEALQQVQCALFPKKLTTIQDLQDWKKISNLFKDYKNIKTISVNALPFHNLNCLAYYEAAIIISGLVEHLEAYAGEFPAADVVVKTGVSSDYFIQIAKLRAIHRLWNLFQEEYKITNKLHLIVETGLTNKSISDSYNNLLRTTIEAMAAVAGGCNELIVTEFDALFATNKSLAERMAINQQLILKEESYLDKMADVSCGSFYIESITDAIAEKALQTFKRFESEGGYFACLEKNIFHKEIEVQAQQRAELVNTQKQIAIGVNKFKNEKEKINLSAADIIKLKQLPIHNPVLNFELANYFQHA
jgi:methylmalonyl-CoA mutase